MDKDIAASGTDTGKWSCKNCGQPNPPEAEHCERCAYAKGYDPEARPDVDFSAVQNQLEREAEKSRRKVFLYVQVAQLVMLVVLAVVAISFMSRLSASWPFTGEYERDAGNLADAALLIHSKLDHGMSKAEYDELASLLFVENTKFKLKYSERPERQNESYQKLVQSAEYFELALNAWENELKEDSAFGDVDPAASSMDASESVQTYWDTAKTNLMIGLSSF